MIELEPASLLWARRRHRAREPRLQHAEASGAGPVTVRGEIVDSKCFLGVMVPGSGKTHKDCASLCLRGGIPPALYVQDRRGDSFVLLLTGTSGESMARKRCKSPVEAIDMTGRLQRQGGWLMLRTDPGTWRPIHP